MYRSFDKVRMSLSIKAGDLGVLQPQINVAFPSGTHWRITIAFLHLLACKITLLASAKDTWLVEVKHDEDATGRVFLDINPSEVDRGMLVLASVLASYHREPLSKPASSR